MPLIGFKSEVVYYDRVSRFAGESKYPLKKMVSLALDAITLLGGSSLRLITLAGSIIFVVSMIITLWALWVRPFTTRCRTRPDISRTAYVLSAIQILASILGEYLAKPTSRSRHGHGTSSRLPCRQRQPNARLTIAFARRAASGS